MSALTAISQVIFDLTVLFLTRTGELQEQGYKKLFLKKMKIKLKNLMMTLLILRNSKIGKINLKRMITSIVTMMRNTKRDTLMRKLTMSMQSLKPQAIMIVADSMELESGK